MGRLPHRGILHGPYAPYRNHKVPAEIIDGKRVAASIRADLARACAGLGHPLRLVSLEVGQNPAAGVYVRNQRRAAEEVGIDMQVQHLAADADRATLLDAIAALNADPEVTGIIVQRPLPPGIDPRAVQGAIAPQKDVEGMNPENMGSILNREPELVPCTAAAAVRLIEETGCDLRGASITTFAAQRTAI